MSDELNNGVPEAVRRIVEGMVSQALAQCDRLGIAREDFYRAMMEEKRLHPKGTVEELFERTFRRLEGMRN